MKKKQARQVKGANKVWCQTCETCASMLPRPALVLHIPAYVNNASLTRLPAFHAFRHFGFLANRSKKQALPQCRKLLGLNPALPEIPKRSAHDLLLELTGIDLSRCPSCKHGTMIVVAELPPISSSSRWDSS
jgi:hypothetical protein